MNKEQILQLLTDYCRTMLYGGKSLTYAESFLHVLRDYLRHGEFMRILRNLKRLEASLAYSNNAQNTWGSMTQTSRLNHQENIPEPEKVIIDFLDFFAEEARRRQEEVDFA